MIQCEYLSTRFSNEGFPNDNGYRVYDCKVIKPDDQCSEGDTIRICGYNIPQAKSLQYLFDGMWKETKYGKQFQVVTFDEIITPTYKGIVGYLSSGKIKGITPSLAEKIYHVFRNETIAVLDVDAKRLREVPGIGPEKCNQIIESYEKERVLKKIVLKYRQFKVSEKVLQMVYKDYGKNTEKLLEENPYILNEYGVDIMVIDKFSKNLPSSHTGKAEAIILSAIKESEEAGNTCVPSEEYYQSVIKKAARYKIQKNILSQAEDNLCRQGKVIYLEDCVARKQMYDVESDCARELFRILNGFHFDSTINIDEEIKTSEKRLRCSLHIIQKEAVKKAIQSGILIITGGPGTGKTTVVKVIRDIFERVLKKSMMFIAPTGRAAARMKESSGYPAFTAHKKLQIFDDNLYDKQAFCVEEDCTVCDETSMVDVHVGRRIFQSIKTGNQLILLGDVEQLPSVGPGAVLKDMIDSGYIPTVCLTKVFRQSSDSNIYLNCRKIVKGNLSLEYGDDFVLLDAYTQEEAADLMADTFMREVEEFGLKNVCCLTPFRRKTPTGAVAMNKRIQKLINPPDKEKPEIFHFSTGTIFRLGDRVMSLRNTEKTSNGDLGFIVEVIGDGITVEFSECTVRYECEELDDIALAYCMTIHKSQGSEFKSVISTMLESHGDMLQMNLLNTAVSRAKVRYTCVGNEEAINIAILNRDGITRCTKLCEKIISIFQQKGIA